MHRAHQHYLLREHAQPLPVLQRVGRLRQRGHLLHSVQRLTLQLQVQRHGGQRQLLLQVGHLATGRRLVAHTRHVAQVFQLLLQLAQLGAQSQVLGGVRHHLPLQLLGVVPR